MSEEAILDRIRKLLMMTTEQGCSEMEAANAAKFAARLMAKHGITQERIGAKSENAKHAFRFARGRDDWQEVVAIATAKRFGCAVYFETNGAVFFGRGEAPIGAGEVWSWLVGEMPRVALRNKAHKHKDMQRYMMGMAVAVRIRLEATEEKPDEVDRFAIVRADTARDEMMEEVPGLVNVPGKDIRKLTSNVAFLMGLADGADVPLGMGKTLETGHPSQV